ncbi:glycosyltransferase [Nanoarchaeota archaeon]
MSETIMFIGGIILGLLFAFLLFIFITIIISYFNREKFDEFTPNVSIIIPCYNEEKNIGDCLESIYKSDYDLEKFEVLVVDDGSKDKTKNIVEDYQNKYSNLRLIKGEHKGKSASLNLGTEQAKHEFILTLDADTIIKEDAIGKILKPFGKKDVGATNGSCMVKNKNTILSLFQNMEYIYNNLIRKSFSDMFKNGIWFFGAFACYRKSVLEKIGYFKKHTLTEDMDIALEIYSSGYRVINVHDAYGYTIVPITLSAFFKQRTRWWLGVLQSLNKSKKLFSRKSSPSILFLFVNQYWWTFYALISLPLIAYQYSFWLVHNTNTFTELFMYTFRWFTFLGPIHVIYMIPEWGISFFSIFGVLSGIISVGMMIYALYLFGHKLNVKNIIVLFFYFPYCIVLNLTITFSLLRALIFKKSYFIS